MHRFPALWNSVCPNDWDDVVTPLPVDPTRASSIFDGINENTRELSGNMFFCLVPSSLQKSRQGDGLNNNCESIGSPPKVTSQHQEVPLSPIDAPEMAMERGNKVTEHVVIHRQHFHWMDTDGPFSHFIYLLFPESV